MKQKISAREKLQSKVTSSKKSIKLKVVKKPEKLDDGNLSHNKEVVKPQASKTTNLAGLKKVISFKESKGTHGGFASKNPLSEIDRQYWLNKKEGAENFPKDRDGLEPSNPSTIQTNHPTLQHSNPSTIQPSSPSTIQTTIDLPTFPDSVYANLPAFFKKIVARCKSNAERDIMLLGSLVPLGACLPKLFGIYDGLTVFPYLYLFITAQASAGKGKLVHCKQLVMHVHLQMRKEAKVQKDQYELDMQKYKKQKSMDFSMPKPIKPLELMLIIPANNSATGVFQLLSENDGCGLLFETEGDTLAHAFKSDHSNYSDGMRKGFQHEAITYYRRTDHELVEILCTRMAAVMSGTHGQVASLIPNAENGLLSRFIFYHMNCQTEWKNVFAQSNHGLEAYFDALGQEFLPLYNALKEHPAIEFCLTGEQEDQFHTFFTQFQAKYLNLQGKEYLATIRRLGLIAFRIAMIFSALRILETGDFSQKNVCLDVDFQAAIAMVKVLVKHSSHVFNELQQKSSCVQTQNKKEQFLDQLPTNFNRADFIGLAKRLFIGERTAYNYITDFCEKGLIFRELQGTYTKSEVGST